MRPRNASTWSSSPKSWNERGNVAELFFQPIAQLATALDAKKVSAVELAHAVIARTKSVDGRLHAFNFYDEADALAQAAAENENTGLFHVRRVWIGG